MPRKLRVEYPGAIYHVMNRGDRREPIFKDDADRKRFLETLADACVKTEWQVHAYCLMPNHFHMVVETPQANLVAGMKWFLGTFYKPLQPSAQAIRTSVQRSLQVPGRGGQRRWVFADGMRLRASESRAGEVAAAGAAVAGIWMEQLSGILEGAGQTSGLAAGGSDVRGNGHSEGQPCRAEAI